MDNQPSLDRSLLIPILIGGFSIVGIIVVLLIGRAQTSPPEIPLTPSATQFRYVYLGTEPGGSTESPVATESGVATEVPTDFPAFPSLPTPTGGAFPFPTFTPGQSVATPLLFPSPGATHTAPNVVLGTATPSRTPTKGSTSTASPANTYDDTDTRLDYSGDWRLQTGLSESGPNPVYQGTLHISDTAGAANSLTFMFTGNEIHLYYQPGSSLGMITIYIDADTLGNVVNEGTGGGTWDHLLDTVETHTVVIRHTGGGSVNIDRLVIPALTPTPTRTPTPTQ